MLSIVVNAYEKLCMLEESEVICNRCYDTEGSVMFVKVAVFDQSIVTIRSVFAIDKKLSIM